MPALTRQVRRICETAANAPEDSRSASAKAVAVAHNIYHDLTEDPLLQCVDRVFPGSTFVLTKAEIEDRLSKLEAA